MITATFAVRAFRARDDSQTLDSTTWTYTQNTAWTQPRDSPFRLRVQGAETAGGASNNVDWHLQYSVNGGTWTDADAWLTTSTQFTNGDAITSGQLGGSGSFLSGVGRTSANTTADYVSSHTGNDYVEIEYALLLPNTLSNNDTVQFRLTRDATVPTMDVTPTLTVSYTPPTGSNNALTLNGSTWTYVASNANSNLLSLSTNVIRLNAGNVANELQLNGSIVKRVT